MGIRVFGRILAQGPYDDTHISVAVDWQAITSEGVMIATGNDVVPVIASSTDSELEFLVKESLAVVLNQKNLGYEFNIGDIIGCKL